MCIIPNNILVHKKYKKISFSLIPYYILKLFGYFNKHKLSIQDE